MIDKVLSSATFSGADQLAQQIPATKVTSGPITFLNFHVSGAVAAATCPNGPVPVRAFVDDAGGQMVGEIIIWVEGGYLSALEYAWVTDERPTELPPPERIRVT